MDSQRKEETYALLSSDPLPSHHPSDDTRLPTSRSPLSYNILTVLICVACVALNLFISTHSPQSPARLANLDYRSVSRSQYPELRRPSPFIGFDSLSRATPPVPRNLLNYPIVLALVNSSRPDQIFSDDPYQHMTATGTISPEARPVILSKEISVILQFRAMDYQMERCRLHVKMASSDTESLRSSTTMAVYRLAAEQVVDTKQLSYSTRPSRTAVVGSLTITPSSPVDWHFDFRCVWDSISTFEVAHLAQGIEDFDSGESFDIKWWQDKDQTHPPQAMYIMQHESA